MANVPDRHAKLKRSTQSLTEQRNPRSTNLDLFSAQAIVRLMNREDRKIAAAVANEIPSITRAVEGAEDAVGNGERDLRARKLTRNDVVVGIAASGTTPYVLGALQYARKCGVATIAVTADRKMPVAKIAKILIAPEVGPEVLTGSTRLKAGTAQKMVLNMLSTAAMVRLGHAYQNLMIDLLNTNKKLTDRSLRILAEASGKNLSTAERALRKSGHSLRVALVILKRNLNAAAAKQLLKESDGNLRRALGEG